MEERGLHFGFAWFSNSGLPDKLEEEEGDGGQEVGAETQGGGHPHHRQGEPVSPWVLRGRGEGPLKVPLRPCLRGAAGRGCLPGAPAR